MIRTLVADGAWMQAALAVLTGIEAAEILILPFFAHV